MMFIFLYVCFLFVTLCFHQSFTQNSKDDTKLLQNSFDKFVHDFNKSYAYGSMEYKYRLNNFLATIDRIQKKNYLSLLVQESDGNKSAIYGITKFSDLSPREFKESFLSISTQKENSHSNEVLIENYKFPKMWDWRGHGIISAVKDQGKCGSCWAFSAVENVESMWAKSNKLIRLSIQQVVDCSTTNFGCRGGSPCSALAWLKQNKIRLVENNLYPYHQVAGRCHNESLQPFGVGVRKFFCGSCHGPCPDVEMREMLPILFANGPLAISVNAISWQDYVGGIIQHHCSFDTANHAVQIVGYDVTGEIPFWIVRNSWGTDFGENGYLRIKMGGNLCGVANSYAGVISTFD